MGLYVVQGTNRAEKLGFAQHTMKRREAPALAERGEKDFAAPRLCERKKEHPGLFVRVFLRLHLVIKNR